MLYWTNYKSHKPKLYGKKEVYDENIYTFDIETTSYIIDLSDDKIYPAYKYLKFKREYKNLDEFLSYGSTMYIWMFGINETVYFGRTWKELKEFLFLVAENAPQKKFLYIHNQSFEFQYLKSYFNYDKVLSRKSHKVMSAELSDLNFTVRCTYYMTNLSLEYVPKVYNLDVNKLTGNLDYSKMRHYKTALTKKELKYCENDCLVIYKYILMELDKYKHLKNIPMTSTGHVRKELKQKVYSNYYYKRLTANAINTNPYIFNLLQLAFMGGYTHANFYYANEVLKNVDSWDFTSSYPYVMVTHKFPMSKFKRCNITRIEDLNPKFAYLLKIKMVNGVSKYYNTFLSSSKVLKGTLSGARYDNGRLLQFKEATIVVTDVDAKYLLEAYSKYDDFGYEIEEAYFAKYGYLPKTLINFILDKYEDKTKYKNVEGFETEYAISKALFNSIFGMTVTNEIRSLVEFDNNTKQWKDEKDLSDDEIIEKLANQEKAGFLSFAWGCWVTAHSRNNLIRNIMKLDKFNIYSDTDSIKLLEGYDKSVIINYNNYVKLKIKKASEDLKIDYNRFQPKDSKGKRHLLGLFDADGNYLEFITQGAKKYAVKQINKKGKEEIKITVAGVPKKTGSKCLTDLSEFKDGFVFDYKIINKQLLVYCDNQREVTFIDYQGNKATVKDKSGCCLLPTNYTLGKDDKYSYIISSSKRAEFKFENISKKEIQRGLDVGKVKKIL